VNKTIHTDISQAASLYPDNIALWGEEGELRYKELDQLSDSLAAWLTQKLPGTGHRIALVLPKTYVPLGDTWSAGRLIKIFEDGQFALVVINDTSMDLHLDTGKFLATDSVDWQQALNHLVAGERFQCPALEPTDPAYILYTSGSTGTPKGVCVSHRAFIVPEKMKVFPARLSEFLQEHGISIIYAVPSTLILLMQRGKLANRDLTAMRTVLFAGEEFPVPLFMQFKEAMPEGMEYCNLYGPTETNVCSYYRVPEDFDLPRMPIGRALPETHLFIRHDGDEADVDAGESQRGELCVAGPTVMTGYHGLDTSKADYWLDDPRGIESRAYATGDQASLASVDVWDYHGRVDNMVKIWGYRVELGEIETCVMEMSSVEQAAVVKRSDGDKIGDVLVAFVQLREVHSDNETVDNYQKDAIRHCKENLPPYMIPREFRLVDEFPLNNRGKIDRLSLAKMAKQARV